MTSERPLVAEWLEVWLTNDSILMIASKEKSRIDAAVEMWSASGGTRDTLLTLDGWVGEEIVVLASLIGGWHLSTVASRMAHMQQQAAAAFEHTTMRSELGIFDAEDD